jgi:hypothetical protein
MGIYICKDDERNSICIIQTLVNSVHDSLNKDDCYPVFGAIGNTFMVEIAQGPIERRNILKTFYIDIKHNLQTEILIENKTYADEEILISIKHEYLLIAMLYITKSIFEQSPYILHPLNARGNYPYGWEYGI